MYKLEMMLCILLLFYVRRKKREKKAIQNLTSLEEMNDEKDGHGGRAMCASV